MCSTCFGHYYIHHQQLATVLLNYHICRLVLSLLCVGDLVRLVLSGVRFAGLQNEHHSKPTWTYVQVGCYSNAKDMLQVYH